MTDNNLEILLIEGIDDNASSAVSFWGGYR